MLEHTPTSGDGVESDNTLIMVRLVIAVSIVSFDVEVDIVEKMNESLLLYGQSMSFCVIASCGLRTFSVSSKCSVVV